MADRGRVGSLVVGSKSCAQKVWRNEHEAHRKRLRKVQSVTDMTMPVTVAMDHVRTNLKKERLLEERYTEIDRENQVLLKKMSEQMKKPNPYIKETADNKPTSLNRTGRKAELLRITKENQRMLKSIQQTQPVYSVQSWEDSYKKSEVLLRNCSTYPVITRLPRTPSAPGVLMQLAPEAGGADALRATGSLSPGRQQEEDRKFVLKEGMRIGETYYLLEMSTDGRTLSISAYDGESQTSMELVVKEKKHRQLYREVNGDYSLIAGRLRVDGSRLLLE